MPKRGMVIYVIYGRDGQPLGFYRRESDAAHNAAGMANVVVRPEAVR